MCSPSDRVAGNLCSDQGAAVPAVPALDCPLPCLHADNICVVLFLS